MAEFGQQDEVIFGTGDQPVVQNPALRFLGQANVGIAEGVGGLVDFINPFDQPFTVPGFGDRVFPGTGSAAEGLKTGMRAIGAEVATEPPEGVLEQFGRGTGEAASAILPVVKGLQGLRSVGGVVGAFADDAIRSLATVPGFIAELTAGGAAEVGGRAAEAAGAPESVQMLAEMAAGGGVLPAALAVPRVALAGARRLPGAQVAGSMARDVQRSLFPMTEAGAKEVASARVRSIAGGEERAGELAAQIDLNDPLALTPAQQTGDPGLLGLERAAAAESPPLADRLAARAGETRQLATEELQSLGGDVGEARSFFGQTLRDFKKEMSESIDTALQMGEEGIDLVGPRTAETTASSRMVTRIKDQLATQLDEERALWAAVPQEAVVSTAQTQSTINRLIEDTTFAQRRDVPEDLRTMFGDDGALGDQETIKELHGLYSEMRRVAREASADTTKNTNRARIANEVADSILNDLGAVDARTPVGKTINDARAFSRALHETFDQGAVGRVLKRTVTAEEAIAPETALRKTVGRAGPEGKISAEKIRAAAPEAAEEIEDFLRGQFTDAITSPTGEFTPKIAERWIRNNRELLNDFPDMQKELRRALSSRVKAESFAARTQARAKLIEDKSAPARFNLGAQQRAVLSIIGADDPAKTARTIVATAKKDKTGRALQGVKAAFTDYLIGGEISGRQLQSLLRDKATREAMGHVFSKGELGRINRVASSLAKLDPAKVTDVGGVIDSPSNKLIEMVVRIAAARRGGSLGGGSLGGSMQTANIFTQRSAAILKNLTNDRARQLLMEAIEKPALFMDLLMEPKSINLPAATRARLAPFLTGAAAAVTQNAGAQ